MTLEELNALRDTYSFPPGVRVRLPDEGETIISARSGEVAFYEAAFPADLCFPIHPTIRLILQFYNICPAQLVPNAWRSIACSIAMWRVFKYTLSLSEFRNLFSLNSNPKLDQGWLYFNARNKKAFLGGYPSNVKGWKSKFFFVSGNEWEIPKGLSQDGVPRVLRTWGIPTMSKRISFKKLGEKFKKSANVSSGTPAPAIGVVIGEKRAEESKKANSSSKAPATPATASSRPGEGTSANLSTVLGPTASILGSPSVAEKLLWGVIPPADKEKVEKLTLDQTATKLFHVIGQKALVLGSSLAIRSREAGEQASLQEGRAASMETEVARLQKLAADLEQQLAEAQVPDKFERSRVLVNELREALDKAKESAVEEFKFSSEFVVAVEDSAFKYFGEGFDFCKVQLRRHHPDLAIDLEGTVVDQDLLAEQDEAAEEKEKMDENEAVNEKDTAPL
ncbi:uncharacterized protein LOC130775314 [Actinidia eriantha]|uniref:uncharacterized protein LOC130775314 n=1 Tax=Actinidia eriantha TaxID=165200 RepID=UPI002588B5D2|nr:uncharacterized protein LOC130775314 [Actinidia eriantha]